MPSTIEFPFSNDEALPAIPITLSHAGFSVFANALLDTGSTVNLLSYDIGLQLGAICAYSNWESGTSSPSICLDTSLSGAVNSWANELMSENLMFVFSDRAARSKLFVSNQRRCRSPLL